MDGFIVTGYEPLQVVFDLIVGPPATLKSCCHIRTNVSPAPLSSSSSSANAAWRLPPIHSVEIMSVHVCCFSEAFITKYHRSPKHVPRNSLATKS